MTTRAVTEYSGTRSELRAELQHSLELLRNRLAEQCECGLTPAGDPLRAMVIEESEAQQLVAALAADLARPPSEPLNLSPTIPDARPEGVDCESPFHRLQRVFRLNRLDFDVLMLTVAVEMDCRFARLVAYLNDHVSRTRPTVGLALAVGGENHGAVDFCQRPVIRQGLLQVEGDGPLPILALRLAPEFLPRLAAADDKDRLPATVRIHSQNGLHLNELAAAPVARLQLGRWTARLRSATSLPPLVLAGPAGVGRATAAQAASAEIGRSLVEVLWEPERADRGDRLGVAAREALWHDATLLVRVVAGSREPDFPGLWALLSAWDLPIALTLSAEFVEPACAASPVEPVVVHLDGTSIEQREALWSRLLAAENFELRVSVSDAERRELASRYDFLPGALTRAVRRAVAERVGSGEPLDFESLARACRAVGTTAMGPLSQRLPQPYSRLDLVLPGELLEELDLASAWIRNQRRVFEDWGFGRRVVLGRGLTALFAGEPGTGKTMAAQVLARELGLELFRVDLSRMMSKYIGETEKNLARLFDDAQASGVILFFDEADALFGKRSEVKDAHDRYANLEIGYLLQRMEEHTGTTVLATNRLGDLDEAFIRRFHFILNFPMPRPPERRRIWESMIPRDAEREPEIDFDVLSRDYEISGGEIRNSVLSAAFIAANQGVPIGLRHLKRGLRRELQKTGRILDSRQRQALEGD